MNNPLKEKIEALKNLESLKKESLPKEVNNNLSNLLSSIPQIEKVNDEKESNTVEHDYENSIFGNQKEIKKIEEVQEKAPEPLKPPTKKEKIAEILEKLYNLPDDNKTQSTNTETITENKPPKSISEERKEIREFTRQVINKNNILTNVDKLEEILFKK